MAAESITVVVTCFELGRTLPEALASVSAQSLPATEVIVVDDGSLDVLTRQVLAALEGDERVRLIRAEHRGPAHARNIGIEASTTPLVVLLDGDDAFEPTYLQKAAEILDEREDLSFVCCALQAFGRASYRWKPPPYTVADALGRGACGHIATVFRRQVWVDVGGFDAAFPAYEDVDFWLRALELGHRGVILDEALVRYRIRAQSRYHSAVLSDDYFDAKQMLIDKHLDARSPRGEDVLATILDFERELRLHTDALEHERAELEAAEADLDHEIAAVGAAVLADGAEMVDWGVLGGHGPGTTERDPATIQAMLRQRVSTVEAELMQRAVDELSASEPVRRSITLRAGDELLDGHKAGFDQIILTGALERDTDPLAMVQRCRALLRDGGQLVVAASTSALGVGRRIGLTEASLRELLCEAFPPESVAVRAYGNLMTSVASVAGARGDACEPDPIPLSAETLALVDPRHPTIVAGVARTPVRTRFRGRSQPPPQLPGFTTVRPARAAILVYHRVAVLHPDPHRLCVSPELFAQQMEHLAAHYCPVPLEQLGAQLRSGELEHGSVAVTFDDGYLDNLEIASEIAITHGIPATFFINGAPSLDGELGWWDIAERVLLGEQSLPERLDIQIGEGSVDLRTRTESERRNALMALHAELLFATPEVGRAAVENLTDWAELEPEPLPNRRLMNTDEVIELSSRPGHAIGSHTLEHRFLPTLPPDEQVRQMRECKSGLEQLLGTPITNLAYPYGACSFEVTMAAQQAGFTLACTTEADPVTLDSDPLRMPRIEIFDNGLERFRLQLEQAIGS